MNALDIDAALAALPLENRTLAEEAVRCLRNGAHRASVVTIWSAIVYDAIRKIEFLHGLGEARVSEAHTRVVSIQANQSTAAKIAILQRLEDEILDILKSQMQLLSDAELVALQSLKSERNLCAHPSFDIEGQPYTPSHEQCLAHITNGIRYVLSRHPLEGNAAVERACGLIASISFPDEPARARQVLDDRNHLGRLSETARKNVVLRLAKGYMAEEEALLAHEKRITAGISALLETSPALIPSVVENLREYLGRNGELHLGRFVALADGCEALLGVRSEAIDQRVYAASTAIDVTAPTVVGRLGGLLKFENVVPLVLARIRSLPTHEKPQALAGPENPLLNMIVAETLGNSTSWDFTSDFCADVVSRYLPIFSLEAFRTLLLGAAGNSHYGGYNQVLGTASGIETVRQAVGLCGERFGAHGLAVVEEFRAALSPYYQNEVFPE